MGLNQSLSNESVKSTDNTITAALSYSTRFCCTSLTCHCCFHFNIQQYISSSKTYHILRYLFFSMVFFSFKSLKKVFFRRKVLNIFGRRLLSIVTLMLIQHCWIHLQTVGEQKLLAICQFKKKINEPFQQIRRILFILRYFKLNKMILM